MVGRGFLDTYPTFCRDQPRTTELPTTRKLDQSIQARFSVLMGLPARQQAINDSQHHHHESIDKEPAISQHENVTENYGSHPSNSQSRSQSGCLRDQEQNR